MKIYPIKIQDEKEWELFKKKYKNKGIGTNLDIAIMSLIKRYNKRPFRMVRQ